MFAFGQAMKAATSALAMEVAMTLSTGAPARTLGSSAWVFSQACDCWMRDR